MNSAACESMILDQSGTSIKFKMGSKVPSQSSIVSNLSSLYEQYNIHITILKWTGVIVLLTVMTISLAITSNAANYSDKLKSDCLRITTPLFEEINKELNETLCQHITQFDLTEQHKVTVCLYQQQIRIDIRYFIGNKTTIRGIF